MRLERMLSCHYRIHLCPPKLTAILSHAKQITPFTAIDIMLTCHNEYKVMKVEIEMFQKQTIIW